VVEATLVQLEQRAKDSRRAKGRTDLHGQLGNSAAPH